MHWYTVGNLYTGAIDQMANSIRTVESTSKPCARYVGRRQGIDVQRQSRGYALALIISAGDWTIALDKVQRDARRLAAGSLPRPA